MQSKEPRPTPAQVAATARVDALLKSHKAGKNDEKTHTNMSGGSYHFDGQDAADFMDAYAVVVGTGVGLHFTEKPQPAALPALVDLDLRWGSADRRYDAAFIDMFIQTYVGVAQAFLHMPESVTWYVLEKPAPRHNPKASGEADAWKDGVHLIAPDIVTDARVQRAIRAAFLTAHPMFFDGMSTTPASQVYDEAVLGSNNWMMYGSGKPEETPATWTVSRVLDVATATREITPWGAMPSRKRLVKTLSIRGRAADMTPLAPKGHDAVTCSKSQHSVQMCNEKKNTKAKAAAATPAACSAPTVLPSMPPSFCAADPVVKLLSLLSKTRWDDYNDWLHVAIALKNDHGDKYRDAWLQFSRISAKFDQANGEAKWRSAPSNPGHQGRRLTMRSVEAMAKADDPHGFAHFKAATVPPVVHQLWNKGDKGLARAAHELLGATIKATEKRSYYFFDDGSCKWVEGDHDGFKLKIGDALEDAMRSFELWLAAQAMLPSADDHKAELDAKKKAAATIVAYVCSNRGLSNIAALASPMFHNASFVQRLDCHAHLLGIAGGKVVDLRTGEARMRAPEDMVFVELKVGCDGDRVPPSPPWIKELVTKMMAGDSDMACFLQRTFGYGLTGEVCEEVFLVLTNSGRGGKGLLMTAFKVLLGECPNGFYVEMEPKLITDLPNKGINIMAERGKLMRARMAVYNETGEGAKLDCTEVQLQTGGDGVPARPLYMNPLTIEPHYLAVLTTNYLPRMPSTGAITATVERLLIVPFPVTFRDLMPGEEETPFLCQADRKLKDRMKSPEGQAALFAWAVEGAVAWYTKRDQGSLKSTAPPKVREFTRKYFDEQDLVAMFLKEHCDFGADMRVSSSELYAEFLASAEGVSRATHSDKWFSKQLVGRGFVKKLMRVPGYMNAVQAFDGFCVKAQPS